MSTTVVEADLRAALSSALNTVELAISLGAQHWDRTTPSPTRDAIWTKLRKLMDLREDIEGALLVAEFDAPDVQAAFAALNRIAEESAKVASHLPTFTGWLEKADFLARQAKKIVKELEKLK